MKNFVSVLPKCLFVTLLTAAAGCTPPQEDKSKTKDGNCTQTFLDSYNAVVGEVKKYSEYNSSAYFTEEAKFKQALLVDRSCRSFYNKHGNVSCKAMVSYSVKNVSGKDFRSVCDKVYEIASTDMSKKTEPTSSDTSARVSTLNSDKVSFTIIDTEALNKIVKSYSRPIEEQQILIEGNLSTVIESARLIRDGVAYCMVSSRNRLNWETLNQSGTRLKIGTISEGYRAGVRVLLFKNEEQNISISCAKNQVAEFTVAEIKKALGSTMLFIAE
jgi:hypothetical protein